MKKNELKAIALKGEDSRLQFKSDIRNVDALAAEMRGYGDIMNKCISHFKLLNLYTEPIFSLALPPGSPPVANKRLKLELKFISNLC